MNITRVHLEFYRSRKPLPKWAQKFNSYNLVTVDHVINANAGVKFFTDGERSAYNLFLSILIKSYRRREPTLVRILNDISISPGTVIHPEKRAAYALKWLKRIARNAGGRKYKELDAWNMEISV